MPPSQGPKGCLQWGVVPKPYDWTAMPDIHPGKSRGYAYHTLQNYGPGTGCMHHELDQQNTIFAYDTWNANKVGHKYALVWLAKRSTM
jgi:hypothetical protein